MAVFCPLKILYIVLNVLNFCFLAVEIILRIFAKNLPPELLRKPPDILVLAFIILKDFSAKLLVNGTLNFQ